jgi:hypothetical protein
VHPLQHILVSCLEAVCEDSGERGEAAGARRTARRLPLTLGIQHLFEYAVQVLLQVLCRRKAAVAIKHGCRDWKNSTMGRWH